MRLLLLILISRACFAQPSFDGPSLASFNRSISALAVPTFIRSASNSATSGSSLTITGFDCSSGNCLVVIESDRETLPRIVSSIKCNGVSLTLIQNASYISASGHLRAYYLLSPTTGDVVVTLSGSTTGFGISANLFNGVTTVGSGANDVVTSLRTGCTNTLTTSSSDLVVDAIAYSGLTGLTYTPGASQTLRTTVAIAAQGSHKASSSLATGSSTSTSWVISGVGDIITWIGFPLSP